MCSGRNDEWYKHALQGKNKAGHGRRDLDGASKRGLPRLHRLRLFLISQQKTWNVAFAGQVLTVNFAACAANSIQGFVIFLANLVLSLMMIVP